MPSSPSLPPVLERAQYELAFTQRTESELLKLTRAFFSDAEINGPDNTWKDTGTGASSARELVEARAERRFEIICIEKADIIEVPKKQAWPFVEALLEPFARKLARLGLNELPGEPTARDLFTQEHGDLLREDDDGPELADRTGYSGHGTSIFESPAGVGAFEPDGEEVRLHARNRAREALAEAFDLLKRYAPNDKRWEERLTRSSEKLEKLVSGAFLPPEKVAASWALEVVTNAFKKLPDKPKKHVLYAYAGKLTSLAGFSTPDEGTSHIDRFRRELQREKNA